jgi:tetratricopeptide (TPR) repeat protein
VKYEIFDSVIAVDDRLRSKESEKVWEARFDWVCAEKEKGNGVFKEGRYQEAINQYLRAYCGIADFAEKQKPEDRESINKDLKGPLLNNLAMCLIKQGKLHRAMAILNMLILPATPRDKPIDPTNFKAWRRKIDI